MFLWFNFYLLRILRHFATKLLVDFQINLKLQYGMKKRFLVPLKSYYRARVLQKPFSATKSVFKYTENCFA